VIADVPIGAHVDAIKIDSGDVLASCAVGALAVAREIIQGEIRNRANGKTPKGARTMGIDPATHRVYLPTAELSPELQARA